MVVNSFYLKTYDSAQIKITLTQIGASVIGFVWLLKVLVDGRWPFSRRDVVFVLPFIGFLCSGLIAWVHTPFKIWSLEETSRRIFYMIFAFVLLAEFQSNERMKRLWRWLVASAWVAIVYGVFQYLDLRIFANQPAVLDPFIWRGAFGPRVFSTFGNPNFYGNFLVIITPIILASVLREKGSVLRVFLVLLSTLFLVLVTDKVTLNIFGGYDASFRYVYGAAIVGFLCLTLYLSMFRIGPSSSLPAFLLLFGMLFINMYATETKGAWIGFIAAIGATVWLIFEFFLHFEEHLVDPKKYFFAVVGIASGLAISIVVMVLAFILPWLRGQIQQIGAQILWIPTLLFAVLSLFTVLWIMRKPWNLKKIIYGFLVFFIVSMGGGVLQFAKTRLVSVSFRMFTWISTWEMIRTEPMFGNGVGTFKIIYPAFRRPEIIALEARSNTETDHSEDEYLEVWQDEGIVGFGIYLWLIITAISCGITQLRWYSNRQSAAERSRKMLDVEGDPRSYEVLGYLGAYIGASIHWFVDVSIRFVSSGIFSGLLPGVLVAYARNHDHPIVNEPRLSYDRWIRFGLVAFWTSIFLWLRLELVPQSMIPSGDTSAGQIYFWCILMGVGLYALVELLEIGNKPEKEVVFSDQYPVPNPKGSIFRWAAFPLIVVLCISGVMFGANQFRGDVHHNLAIFFSKEGIWTKSPAYDSRMMNLPPDLRTKYMETGGALEHYKEVVKKNHAFPMAYYFTGNVYNDWGSQVHSDSMSARGKGDMDEALRLKAKAADMWDKAEAAYQDTKNMAPNYVQTHHQLGLLYVKRAEQAMAWGDVALAKENYAKALANFRKYMLIDPVFPPNYDRIVQLLMMDNKVDECIALYKQALYYNDVVVRSIHHFNFPDRVSAIAISLAKLYFNQVANNPNAFAKPEPQVLEAIKYFQLATENDPKSIEAWKGLGFLLERTGRAAEAQAAYRHALELSPNDKDLKMK